jgi:hypothetical protein
MAGLMDFAFFAFWRVGGHCVARASWQVRGICAARHLLLLSNAHGSSHFNDQVRALLQNHGARKSLCRELVRRGYLLSGELAAAAWPGRVGGFAGFVRRVIFFSSPKLMVLLQLQRSGSCSSPKPRSMKKPLPGAGPEGLLLSLYSVWQVETINP